MSSMRKLVSIVVAAAVFLFAGSALAQPGATPYGMPISMENAKKAAAAAVAEAQKNNWNLVIAISDPGGNLVYFERVDGAPTGSGNVAIGKARSAAIFKAPTKVFQERLAAGVTYLLTLDLVPIEGGIPIVLDGRIVGGIGVSGGSFQQDGQVASAGVAALK